MRVNIVFSPELKTAAEKLCAFSQESFSKFDRDGSLLQEAYDDFVRLYLTLADNISKKYDDELRGDIYETLQAWLNDDVNNMCDTVIAKRSIQMIVAA